MSYSRTITANPGGAFPLNIETNSVRFEMFAEDRRDIFIELSTEDDAGSEAARAIDNAWGEMERNRYRLFVENPNSVVYGNGGGVQFNHFGGVSVSGVYGSVVMSGGRVFIDGVEQRPGTRSSTSRGIVAVVRFPKYSPVEIEGGAGDFRIDGEIGDLEVDTTSGSVAVNQAKSVKARLSSGSFHADAIYGRTDLRASSGSINIAYLNGPFDIVTSFGSTRVGQIHGAGEIEASSGSIMVFGFDGEFLRLRASSGSIEHPENDNRITARVNSGRINGRNPRFDRRGSGGWSGGVRKGSW